MNRKHIPSSALKLGQRVFVVPQRANVARGPGLDPLPAGGQVVTLSDYLFGACQRGAVLAFEPEECSEAELAEHGALLLSALPDGLRPAAPVPDLEPEVE